MGRRFTQIHAEKAKTKRNHWDGKNKPGVITGSSGFYFIQEFGFYLRSSA
jgi:hypothetical protein